MRVSSLCCIWLWTHFRKWPTWVLKLMIKHWDDSILSIETEQSIKQKTYYVIFIILSYHSTDRKYSHQYADLLISSRVELEWWNSPTTLQCQGLYNDAISLYSFCSVCLYVAHVGCVYNSIYTALFMLWSLTVKRW